MLKKKYLRKDSGQDRKYELSCESRLPSASVAQTANLWPHLGQQRLDQCAVPGNPDSRRKAGFFLFCFACGNFSQKRLAYKEPVSA